MAIVARIFIDSADQDDHDRLQHAVETALHERGGPPDGLMVHVGHPHDGGLMIVEAWRNDDLFLAYHADILIPALRRAGLSAAAPEVTPAWSIARP